MSWYEKGLNGLLYYAYIHCKLNMGVLPQPHPWTYDPTIHIQGFTERCRIEVVVEDPC
ncbi:hypothetical protein MKX03_026657 [Papaver bracteatum]|nr:hypothetical protein MKX03_026657 [Papaver bracteatum]